MLPDRLSERQAVAGGFSHLIFHLPKHRSDLRPDLWCLAGSGCAGYGTGVGGWVCKLGAFLVRATVGEGAPLSSSSVSSLVETHPITPASCVSKGKKKKKRQVRNVSREDVGCHPKELIGLRAGQTSEQRNPTLSQLLLACTEPGVPRASIKVRGSNTPVSWLLKHCLDLAGQGLCLLLCPHDI